MAADEPRAATTDVDLGQALADWLSEREGAPVEVGGLERASAGARRLNALVDLRRADGVERVALTMNPSAEVEIITVSTEAAVRRAAEAAGVPVPTVRHVCEDPSVLGGPFFLSAAVDGASIPRHVLRLADEHALGPAIVGQLGAAMARLHSIDATRAPAEVPRPTGSGPVASALAALDEALGEMHDPSPAFSMAVRRLERSAPDEPDHEAIVHRDIRVGNLIVDEGGVAAVLDWETCHVGDPMEDLAWPCVRMWRFRRDDRRVGGLGSIEELRSAYVGDGGDWSTDRFEWWRLLSTVRWGVSMAGQARAHLDGRHRSIVMAASGRRVAELEWDALMLMSPDRPPPGTT